MNEVLKMSDPPISLDSINVISSPGSGDGRTPSDAPDGPTTVPSGPAPVPANLSARQAKELGLLTSGTCGLRSSISSRSQLLAFYLGNRLRARVDSNGLMSSKLIWKVQRTPVGRGISALMPSVRLTSASVCIGLPTPQSMDRKGTSEALRHKFRKTGHLKHWTHGTELAVHSSSGRSSWPNPMFVEWMMGFPRLWISGHDYTPTGMQ